MNILTLVNISHVHKSFASLLLILRKYCKWMKKEIWCGLLYENSHNLVWKFHLFSYFAWMKEITHERICFRKCPGRISSRIEPDRSWLTSHRPNRAWSTVWCPLQIHQTYNTILNLKYIEHYSLVSSHLAKYERALTDYLEEVNRSRKCYCIFKLVLE